MEPTLEATDITDADDTRPLTVAELETYIQQLKRHIELLQVENRRLFADVQEYQRRELELVLRRAS